MTIMEDYRIQREKNVAVHAVLSRAATSQQSQLFFDAFRLATFGRETKSFAEKLAAFLDNWHEILLDCPAQEAWGQPEDHLARRFAPRVVPGSPEPRAAGNPRRPSRDEIGPGWGAGREAEQWSKFCDFVRTFNTIFPSAIGSGSRMS
jgi:hypothetical protein